MRVTEFLQQLWRDCRGATAIEYGLIVALIFLAIAGAIQTVADEDTGLWAVVQSRVEGAM